MAEVVALISLIGLGFVIGVKHAIEADHVIAVSTIVTRTRNIFSSLWLGGLWGLGHTVTLFVAGLIVLLLKVSIPESVSLTFEFIVGVVLVILGIDVMRKLLTSKGHLHVHQHGDILHSHYHEHPVDNHYHKHRSFVVGLIHGMAGSGALVLLVLATVEAVWQGLLFISVFGIGSLVGMMLVSTLISLPLILPKKVTAWQTRIQWIAGVLSVFFGGFVMFSILQASSFLAI